MVSPSIPVACSEADRRKAGSAWWRGDQSCRGRGLASKRPDRARRPFVRSRIRHESGETDKCRPSQPKLWRKGTGVPQLTNVENTTSVPFFQRRVFTTSENCKPRRQQFRTNTRLGQYRRYCVASISKQGESVKTSLCTLKGSHGTTTPLPSGETLKRFCGKDEE